MSTLDEPASPSPASVPSALPPEVSPNGHHAEAEAREASATPAAEQPTHASRMGFGVSSLAWELLQTVVLTLVIFLAVRSVVQNFRVEGASMEPTLQGGQYMLINKAAYFRAEGTPLERLLPAGQDGSTAYLFGGPQRGDVAVFRSPTQPDKDFIKRIIGLPGDQVLIRNGQVFVNGERLNEPYVQFHATYNYPLNGQPYTVPDGHYFVLGDNRPNSSDSHLGWVVPVDNLVGRAWFSYWPPGAWGPAPHAAHAR